MYCICIHILCIDLNIVDHKSSDKDDTSVLVFTSAKEQKQIRTGEVITSVLSVKR